jgi:hypothetical protein
MAIAGHMAESQTSLGGVLVSAIAMRPAPNARSRAPLS